MQDVWVEDGFLGYEPITEEEAQEKIETGHYVCVDIQNESVSGETWTVHLIVYAFMGVASDEWLIREKVNKYLEYVFAITGLNQKA